MKETNETWVRSLSWGDPLEEGMATCSDILGWIIPWTEEPGRLQSMGLQGVRYNWSNLACAHCFANTFFKVDSSSSKVPFIPSMWQSLCNHQASLGLVIYCNLSPPPPGNSREQNTARLQNNKIMRNVELFFLSFIFLKKSSHSENSRKYCFFVSWHEMAIHQWVFDFISDLPWWGMRSGGAKKEPIGVVPTPEAAEAQSPEMSLGNKQSLQALMFPSSFKKQMVFHQQDAITQIQRSCPYSRQLLPSKRQIRGSEI